MKLKNLSLKITLPVLAIVTLAIAFNGYLSYAKFQKHLTQVEMSRMRFSVDDIRANLEIGLRLGLPVKAIANAQEIITFAARKDSSIISVGVFDHTGEPLFTTGREGSVTSAPENWRASVIKKGKTLEIITPYSFLVLVPLQGITEDYSGAMAIQYSRDMHDKTMREVLEALVPKNSAAIILSILIGALGVHWLVSKALRKISVIERSLELTYTKNSTTPATDNAGEIVQPIIAVARRAIQEIRDTGKELGQK
jgi:hypothetical protein